MIKKKKKNYVTASYNKNCISPSSHSEIFSYKLGQNIKLERYILNANIVKSIAKHKIYNK